MKKATIILDFQNYSKTLLEKISKKTVILKCNSKNVSELKKYISKKSKKYEIFAIFTKFGIYYDEDIILSTKYKLKFLVSPTTGLNHIKVLDFKKKNIKILYLKNRNLIKNVSSTAEHAWALILYISKNLGNYNNKVLRGKWERGKLMNLELSRKTIGIIGFGRLGKLIAGYAKAFKMKILVFDKKKNFPKYVKFCNLNKIFLLSDIISINLSYEKNNKKIINNNVLSKSKKNLILVNTARGELIDQKVLFNYLKLNKIKSAGLDVLEDDSTWDKQIPEKTQKKITELKKKLIITPHVGGYSIDAVKKTTSLVVNEFIKNISYLK